MGRTVNVSIRGPHSGMRPIMENDSRFHVVFAGRRFGKTENGNYQLLVGTKARPGAVRVPGIYWWVGLSWRAASMKKAWRELKRITRGWCEIREAEREIHLPNGSELWLRSSEAAESLSGEGVRGLVADEFTMWPNGAQTWAEHLRPTLTDFKGWASFYGVPKGKNWGWRLWSRGNEGHGGEWASFQMPTTANPFIDPKEVEAAREDMPASLFEQEYLAAIVDDGAGFFRNVLGCVLPSSELLLDEPVPGRSYVVGVDWGKLNDYTVVVVLDDASGEVVKVDRFNRIDYNLQRQRIRSINDTFRPTLILAERNSIGEPNIEELVRDGLPIQGFTTTQQSKTLVMDALQLAFERSAIRIPDQSVLVSELQAYGAERLPGGSLRLSAPDGMHDDTVVALALAWHAARGNVVQGQGWLKLAREARDRAAAAEEAAKKEKEATA